ncbi:DUF5676 family membrane protein [Microvirga terrestris]|uniref:Uncharacterized protein n=1 Tax=Microvirga terrestris TaxID=2791024 RepID=A0ABS0HW41_9HYPH|nr:DUF5676 family membrane protein [Microvirga terrestris]MBF9197375.1 hypothetical protein [Microvirga terrestris]
MSTSTFQNTVPTAETRWTSPMNLMAAGWALTTTLVGLFILCYLVALVWPAAGLAHGWIGMFANQPDNVLRTFAEGIIGSAVTAWVTTTLFVPLYNRLISRL